MIQKVARTYGQAEEMKIIWVNSVQICLVFFFLNKSGSCLIASTLFLMADPEDLT